MARVVQRKGNPPYLLIVFAFLFVAAALVATLMYFKLDEASTARAKDQAAWAKLASQEQMLKIETPPEGTTILSDKDQQIRQLTQAITGLAGTTKDALARADEVRKGFDKSGAGLAVLLADASAQKAVSDEQIKKLQGDLKLAQDDKDSAIKAQEAQQAVFTGAEKDSAKTITKLTADNAQVEKDKQNLIDQIKADNQKAMDAANKQMDQLTKKLQDSQEKNRILDMIIAKMKVDIRDLTKTTFDINLLLKQPKGKVVEVVDQTAYISRGGKDRVVPGMTFAVYPLGAIDEKTKSKANLEVINVNDFTSECKIKDMKITNPVLSGDLIQNAAYDPQRVYTFVVMGDFDLHGTNKPNRQGYEEVKSMIQRSGGKIADDLSIRTDFLVMGDEPPRPPKLGGDATEQEAAVNAAQMRAYEEFNLAKRKAAELYIPILNANRFLTLIGYTPDKAK